MKKHRILAMGALFVGFMGIAVMGRTGRFDGIGVMDVVQLVASGVCVGAAMVIFIGGRGNGKSATPVEASK